MDSTASASFTRQFVAASAVVFLTMTGVGWRYLPNDRVDLVENRVVVARFQNITGDPDLDPKGRIVAHYLTRSLGRIDGLDVVPSDDAFSPSAGPSGTPQSDPTLPPTQALAERTKAGLIINGSYYLAGDDLMYQAEVYDADKREMIFAAEAVRADPVDPTLSFPQLLDGLLGFMGSLGAALAIEETGAVFQSSRAPTYTAYKEYALGVELVRTRPFQWQAQLAHLDSAVSLDSTFVDAMLVSASIRSRRDPATGPPILARIESKRSELSGYERAQLDLIQARVTGDLRGAYRASAEVAELVGTSASFLIAGQSSIAINRPKAAIAHFLDYDRARLPIPAIWGSLAMAFHMTGRHGPETRLLRQGLERFPTFGLMWTAKLRAMAARGKGALVFEELDGFGVGDLSLGLVLDTADELDTHGDPESAQTLRERLFEREGSRALEERRRGTEAAGWEFILLSLDCNKDAGAWFRSLLETNPDDVRVRVAAAIAAARTGDRDYAEETIEWLGARDSLNPNGRNTLEQAHVAASLGDAERTVRYLEQAFEQGAEEFAYLHRTPWYRDVRDHPAFQDFMRGRG